MIVRCISTYLKDEDIERLGDFFIHQDFGVTIAKEYLIIGISFHINLPGFGTGVQIQFIDDGGNLAFAPLFMFEITDGRPSSYWEARFYEDGSFQFQPSSFYKEYYHDDLSNGVPEIVENFQNIRRLLEVESGRFRATATFLTDNIV